MTIFWWLYITLAVIGVTMSIIMFIAIVRIWQILSEIVASGAIPSVLEVRAKRDARKILKAEYIYNPQKLAAVTRFLSSLTGDEEAIELLHKLNLLKERST